MFPLLLLPEKLAVVQPIAVQSEPSPLQNQTPGVMASPENLFSSVIPAPETIPQSSFSSRSESEVLIAQVLPAPDGTGTQVDGVPNGFEIRGGQQSGPGGENLFHSFEMFDLEANQSANFVIPSTINIRNIFGRVVGGSPSLIDGLLQVTGSNANLFLINPAGILFGPNARLDLPGSFTATTATGIGFEGGWFNATGPNNFAALNGEPNQFAFLTSQPGAIINFGNLSVINGQSLTLIGGTVLSPGTLEAPGGELTIATVAEGQMLRITQEGLLLSLDIPTQGLAPLPFTPLTLPELLTGGTITPANGVVINPDGTIQLTTTNVPITTGDVAVGDLTTATSTTVPFGDVTASGGAIAILSIGNLITGAVDSSAQAITPRGNATATGGPVSFTAEGILQTGAIDSSSMAQGDGSINRSIATSGAVLLDNEGAIVTGAINTSAIAVANLTLVDEALATGGSVRLDSGSTPNSPIRFERITTTGLAEGLFTEEGVGGAVDVLARGVIQGTGARTTLQTQGTTTAGPVTLQHDGGVDNHPFLIGDASQNGLAGSINTGDSVLDAGEFANPGTEIRGTNGEISITFVNTPPTTPATVQFDSIESNSLTLTFEELNALVTDADGDNTVLELGDILNGTVTRNGVILRAGDVIRPGDVVIYTPPEEATGALNAFTVRGSDRISTSTPALISLTIAPSTDPPIINPPVVVPPVIGPPVISPPPSTPTEPPNLTGFPAPPQTDATAHRMLGSLQAIEPQSIWGERLGQAPTLTELVILKAVLPEPSLLILSPAQLLSALDIDPSNQSGGPIENASVGEALVQEVSPDVQTDDNPAAGTDVSFQPEPEAPTEDDSDTGAEPGGGDPVEAPEETSDSTGIETDSTVGSTTDSTATDPATTDSTQPGTDPTASGQPDSPVAPTSETTPPNADTPGTTDSSVTGDESSPGRNPSPEASTSPEFIPPDPTIDTATPPSSPPNRQSTQQTIALASQMQDCSAIVATLGATDTSNRTLATYDTLIACYEHNLAIAREFQNYEWEVYALHNLAVAHFVIGEYTQALDYHQQQVEQAQTANDPVQIGLALSGKGNVYGALGDYKAAIDAYQQSLTHSALDSAPQWKSLTLRNLGNAYLAEQNYEQAIQYQEASLTLSKAIGDRPGEAQALGNLGNAHTLSGAFPQGITYQEQSLALARELGDRLQEGQSLLSLGTAYSYQQNYPKALEYYQQSLTVAQEINARLGEGIALTNLGDVLLNLNQLQPAEQRLVEALQVWESLRAGLGTNDAFKISIFETQLIAYRNLQEVLVAQNRTAEALEVAERGRARAFVELLARRLTPSPATPASALAAPPTLDEIRQIARDQNATLVEYTLIRKQRVDAPHGASVQYTTQPRESNLFIWVVDPTGDIAFRQVDLTALQTIDETSLAQLVEVARLRLRGSSPTAIANRGVNEPSEGLQPGDRVRRLNEPLSWQPYEVIAINSADGTATLHHPDFAVPYPVPLAELYKPDNTRAEHRLLQSLHEVLIAPIADLLPEDPEDRLIFVPQDQLFLIPFPALQNADREFLIDNHTILTVPAIQVLGLTHQQRQALNTTTPPAPSDILIVGNPAPMPNSLAPLPNAEQEAHTIARLLNTTPLIGASASESAIQARLSSARIIHLATHGNFNEANPLQGSLALAPDPPRTDGFLTAAELLDQSLTAELVVLSACDTGRGRVTGDGVIGLSRSLIAAGVPSVIVSLWQVPDEATAALMIDFYRSRLETNDNAQALRQAMLTTMERYPDPRAWAAFTLVGEATVRSSP